ncbi:60S ribosomal protein L7 [Diplonema papillatum]|nr:60S ribosomal protein L7 [Diplonema papillatum]
MGKNLNVSKNLASGPGERITTTILKRRKKIETLHADKVRKGREHEKAVGQRKKLRKMIFRNARDFVNNFKRREDQKKEISRRQKVQGQVPLKVPATTEGAMAFAIRVKGDDIPETCKRMLAKWRLTKMYDGVFITINQETLQSLHLLRDYVKWGYPTPEQIRFLIRTRGYTRNESGMRVPIGGNQVVEDKLGDHNILCIEDIEHAIATHSPVYQQVVDFLAPFKLEPPGKDQAEAARRKRARHTDAGEGTFASFMLTCMPDLPQTKAPEPVAKSKAATPAEGQPKKKCRRGKKKAATPA